MSLKHESHQQHVYIRGFGLRAQLGKGQGAKSDVAGAGVESVPQ